MGRRWLVGALLGAVAWSLLAPGSASSKGPVVRAPAELRPEDCEPGSRPRLGTDPRMERYYRDNEVLVIGCAKPASERKVLVAVEPEAGGWTGPGELACFYAVAERRWDADPRCLEVDPDCCPGPQRPVGGHSRASIMSAVRPARRGPMYVTGQASANLPSVVVTYRMPWGESRERAAELLSIGPRIRHRIGGAGGFVHFVGEVPAAADTCRGVAVEGRDGDGRALDHQPVERSARASPSTPLALPGTGPCRGRDPLRDAIAEIVWLPLSGCARSPFSAQPKWPSCARWGTRP